MRRNLLYMLQHCACPPIAASVYARTLPALEGEASQRVMANSVSRRSLERSALFEGDDGALFASPI